MSTFTYFMIGFSILLALIFIWFYLRYYKNKEK